MKHKKRLKQETKMRNELLLQDLSSAQRLKHLESVDDLMFNIGKKSSRYSALL